MLRDSTCTPIPNLNELSSPQRQLWGDAGSTNRKDPMDHKTVFHEISAPGSCARHRAPLHPARERCPHKNLKSMLKRCWWF